MSDDAFTRAVRAGRRARDMTQADLARAAGCATVTLKRIEAGDLRPSRQLAERLLDALGVPPDARADLVRLARLRVIAKNPYKGLRAFEEADAADFFGREPLVEALLERVRQVESLRSRRERSVGGAPPDAARLLAVIGPSGSGKSSLVRAGLLPALRGGAVPELERPRVGIISPGAHPAASLDAAERQMGRWAGGVLLVDQFEELWSLCGDDAERAAFLHRVGALATRPGGPWVLLTLRADFYDRPLQHHAFGTLLREAAEVLLPLAPDEIVRAAVGPAERAGLMVDPALLAALVADVAERPGALPLLQYALTELFERRAGARLTLEDYRAVGGVAGAISHRADALYEGLDDSGREAARGIFTRLVQLGDAGEVTRRRVAYAELPGDAGEVAPVVELFTRYRLLTRDRDAGSGAATVDLAHESLAGSWGRLAGWVAERRDELRVRQRLARAAGEWAAAGREASFLASGARLAQFEPLAGAGLGETERAYLDASVAERERLAAAERAREEALRESLARSEAQRLAAEALRLHQQAGSAELIGLLALRSLALRYTPQGDEALCAASLLDLPARHFAGHAGRIYAVAYAPDGRSVLTGGQDLVIREWDAASGRELRRLAGHTGNIRDLAFAPDGGIIASGGDDQTARLWDAGSGGQRSRLPHSGHVQGLAFSPDGRRLLTWGTGPLLRVWDAATGALLDALDTGARAVRAAAWWPDGASALANTSDGRTLCWEGGGAVPQETLRESITCFSIAVSPDGRLLVTTHMGKYIARLWDAATGACLRVLRGHTDVTQRACFTPDGLKVATSSNDSTVRLWDVATGAELRRFSGHNNLVWDHALSPDGRFLLAGGTDGTATLWDTAFAPAPAVLGGHGSCVMASVLTPDGRAVVTVCEDLTLWVWDASTGAKVHCWPALPAVVMHGGLAALPDSQHVVVGCDDAVGRVVEIATGRVVRELRGHRRRVWGAAVSPDGRRILTTSSDSTARLWDARTGEALQVLAGHTDLVVGAAFSPDGRLAATGSDDGTVRLWDAASGEEVGRLRDRHFPMVYAAVSPCGGLVLTGSADGSVRLWERAGAREIWRVTGHHGYINGVQISADGRLGLSAGQDRTARVWDLARGAEVRRLSGHGGGVYGASFAPGGRHILTCSGDHTARLWHLDWRDTAAGLRARLRRGLSDEERAQYGLDDPATTT